MDYDNMGTKNKAVTAYLPEEIEARLTAFCLENGLSRQGKKSGKEKPALGTGIIEVLRIFFSADLNGNSSSPVLDKDELQAIVSKTLPSNVPTQEWVQTEIQQAIAQLKSELNGPAQTTETQPSPEKKSPLVLKQADLARRLRSNPSTLSRHNQKGGQHFAQWSKAKDPESVAWQYRGVEENSKMYETIEL
ncbi:hypothetical protein FEK30_10445 [Picosynechococcus sp. PCC 11901]|uniref:hypothetical protein n=1 Tax=Picosynechococcus sp. PCC 11901 TaxID=2579791 RepID=UPI0010FC1DB0|nr:hypothetical protein [Picosynechococcus sp. PCC 11901]QCS49825.1 hypothetical protein FEK30_10445 [Picosynechococcus sp. PCC 11901]